MSYGLISYQDSSRRESLKGGRKKMGKLTSEKAKKILKDKSVKGHPLTAKQKRFMGWVAGGKKKRGK